MFIGKDMVDSLEIHSSCDGALSPNAGCRTSYSAEIDQNLPDPSNPIERTMGATGAFMGAAMEFSSPQIANYMMEKAMEHSGQNTLPRGKPLSSITFDPNNIIPDTELDMAELEYADTDHRRAASLVEGSSLNLEITLGKIVIPTTTDTQLKNPSYGSNQTEVMGFQAKLTF